jgi:hypothetical protein
MWSKVLSAMVAIVPFAIFVCFVFFSHELWSKVLFLILIDVVFLILGSGAALAVWQPPSEGQWKGTGIAVGRVTWAGAAILFLSAGLALAQSLLLPRWQNWLWYAFGSGFLVVSVGYALDARGHDRAFRAAQTDRPKRGFWDLGYEWGFAVLVVLVLLIVSWLYIAHGRSWTNQKETGVISKERGA